jgi:hypothetical protein
MSHLGGTAVLSNRLTLENPGRDRGGRLTLGPPRSAAITGTVLLAGLLLIAILGAGLPALLLLPPYLLPAFLVPIVLAALGMGTLLTWNLAIRTVVTASENSLIVERYVAAVCLRRRSIFMVPEGSLAARRAWPFQGLLYHEFLGFGPWALSYVTPDRRLTILRSLTGQDVTMISRTLASLLAISVRPVEPPVD